MMNNPSAVVSNIRSDYDLPNSNTAGPYSYKSAYSFPGRGTPHSSLSIAEQAELEYELRYRGNMIVDQQRKIQQLEEELRQARDQVDMMNNQLSTYEQDRVKEKKKPQSRYWTPEEHQRFLEALQKYGHKDVKSISMHVSTRNATQVRTHAQKYFLRLERERRKKEDNTGGENYDSSGSFEDDGSPGDCDETISSQVASVSISSLTLPGSPAVMSDSIGTPPGTPGHESGPGTPNQAGSQSPVPSSSPVPIRRRRATSFISVAQARLAAQHRDSVLVGLPPTWTVEDYDCFMKGLLSMADKQDDVQTLCRLIREQYLPHHTPDEVELCYRNVLRDIKHKPLAGSPKRRRTNSRPEPLSSSLGLAAHLSPSFPVPPVSTLASSFPFRNSAHSPVISSNSPNQGFNSTPSSPLAHSQSIHSPQNMRSPFSEYGQLPNGMDFPLLGELNLNGVSMNNNHNPNINSMNQQMQMNQNTMPPNSGPNNMQQMQGLSILPNSPQNLNNSNPITPSSLWGNALPFSFDALMSGNVSLSQAMPLASHN